MSRCVAVALAVSWSACAPSDGTDPVPLVQAAPDPCPPDALPFAGGCVPRAGVPVVGFEGAPGRLVPRRVGGRTWLLLDRPGRDAELQEVCAQAGAVPFLPYDLRTWSVGMHFASLAGSPAREGTVLGARVDVPSGRITSWEGEPLFRWAAGRPPHAGVVDNAQEQELQEEIAAAAAGEPYSTGGRCLRLDTDGVVRVSRCSADRAIVCADPSTAR